MFKSNLVGKNLQQIPIVTESLCLYKKMTPGSCLPLPRGHVHVYEHYFQTSFQFKAKFYSEPLEGGGGGGKSLYKWSRSHYQDGYHAHIWLKPLKIFFRSRSPMILKLGLDHWGLKVYKVYINDDLGLTLTYFMARSNLITYMVLFGIN